jgi:hypothetical protein
MIQILGIDVFIRHQEFPIKLTQQSFKNGKLTIVSNRGTKIWPGDLPPIHLTDVHRCRFMFAKPGGEPAIDLLKEIENAGFEWVHIEKLLEINGQAKFAKAQGE